MATYAIGDIQGCYYAFTALLARLNFNTGHDRLWLVGDLVNRGNGSLEVLRWCYVHQNVVTAVLGNHDLHTLVVAEGFVKPHRSDTLDALLAAPDCSDLLNWLRHQSMMHVEQAYAMVHAGVLPQWTIAQASALGAEVELALRSSNHRDFLANMYGNLPNQWHDDLVGFDRLRVITNAMTRLRICDENGVMEFAFKGELADIPDGLMPWFEVPTRQSKANTIIFGHWSALATQPSPIMEKVNVLALDTGCLWGKQLTAFCLETKAVTQVPSDVRDTPIKKSFKL
ncbi:MAG: symmetrical bis(5'-nucleosyl)-tetraphosphatase [Methylophilaceae bacterium]|nr:symmetrical bis(5'-nucleosyl)-tetraphosphatase [Methylophilaceae bacterium]